MWPSRSLFKLFIACSFLACYICCIQRSEAASIIRDAETDDLLYEMIHPIFQAAGLQDQKIAINLIADSSINAFVMDGKNIFLYTGLLQATDSPEEFLGVIAHETAHIANNHVSHGHQKQREMEMQLSMWALLSMTAGFLTDNGNVGAGLMLSAQEVLMKNALKHSRIQEASADESAVKYLNALGISTDGFAHFMKKLSYAERGEKLQPYDLYLRSHPFSKTRLEAILDNNSKSTSTFNTELTFRYNKLKAKIDAYLLPQTQVLKKYKNSEDSASLYAIAIAYLRSNNFQKASSAIDRLIAREPNNPYFYELKAQILYKNSKIEQAIKHYKKAIAISSNQPLLCIETAEAMLASNNPKYNHEALALMQKALITEHKSAYSWYLLSKAMHNTGNKAGQYLALAYRAKLLEKGYKKLIHEGEKHKIKDAYTESLLHELQSIAELDVEEQDSKK